MLGANRIRYNPVTHVLKIQRVKQACSFRLAQLIVSVVPPVPDDPLHDRSDQLVDKTHDPPPYVVSSIWNNENILLY